MFRAAAGKTCRLRKKGGGGGSREESQVSLIASQLSELVVNLVMKVTSGTRNERKAQSACKTPPFASQLTAGVGSPLGARGRRWAVSILDQLRLQLPGPDVWRDASPRTR